jgi:hypothetical protein
MGADTTGTSTTGYAFQYSYTFYQSLDAASTDDGGTQPSGSQEQMDIATKYVKVVVTPVTIPTMFPVSFLTAGAADSFSSGAEAVAGFTATTVCQVTSLFICNPYETSGMTDTQATQALTQALDPSDPNFSAATLRKMLRMVRTGVGPGNFGWVQTADGCNNTSCMRTNLAAVGGACYTSFNITLATGNKNSVEQYIDTRFDIYSQNPKPTVTTANAPSINVRKGYLPDSNGNWCNALPANQVNASSPYYTTPPVTAIVNITGNTNGNSNKTYITGLSSTANISAGMMIADTNNTNIPFPTTVVAVNPVDKKGNSLCPSTPCLQISSNAKSAATNLSLTIHWPTSSLPLDRQWTGLCSSGTCVQGNGDWDCADYWAINHPTTAAPAGCTSSNPTISRYQVYRYEITNNLINDWSGNNLADNAKNATGNGENGAPYCAAASSVSGVDTTTGGLDRREFITPIINCLAQAGSINNNSNSNVPVANFAKFFMTQPWEAPPPPAPAGDGATQYIYGEMTGLVSSGDRVTILNQVQLYR